MINNELINNPIDNSYGTSQTKGYSQKYINENVVVSKPLKVLGPISINAIAANSNVDVNISSLLSQITNNSLCLLVVNANNHSSFNSMVVCYLGINTIHTFNHTIYKNNITVATKNSTTINIANTSSSSTSSAMQVRIIQLSVN